MMKRTNIVLDQDLVKKGMRSTGLKTCRALVNFALREIVRRENQADLLKWKGKISWKGDLSKMRQGRDF